MLLELVVIQYRSFYAIDSKDTVKTTRLYLCLYLVSLAFYHVSHVRQFVHAVGIGALLGLIRKVVNDVSCHDADTLWSMQCFIRINAPHLLSVHIAFHAHGRVVIHMERQYVLVPDGIDNGIGMQCFCWSAIFIKLATKELCSCCIFTASTGINGKDGSTRKAKHQVTLHAFGNKFVHIAKLTTMALIEYQYNIVLCQHLTQLLILLPSLWLQQVRQLLYGCNNDMTIIIF